MFKFGTSGKKVHFQLGSDKKSRRKIKGSSFSLLKDFGKDSDANCKTIDSPLFGEIRVPDQTRFLGMSKKARVKLTGMCVILVILFILILMSAKHRRMRMVFKLFWFMLYISFRQDCLQN